jgi:hypothetical protein
LVFVRKMAAHESADVARAAKEANPKAPALEEALSVHPERVRVAEIGHERVGAFVLAELEGGVEEISGLALTEIGLRAGAERAVVEYVVSAAKFGGKRAVEVIAPEGSAEARHLLQEGFHAEGGPLKGLVRFRIDLKPPRSTKPAQGSAAPRKTRKGT